MLETAEERVKLLRAGFTEKAIETLYVKYNKLKIVQTPLFFELVEFECSHHKKFCMSCQLACA
ncbi:MAG: hypothetical protein O8C66_06305 [Candidatus Methanoperedens sp.]|nr:hypothetical protein [Candidatus Methanoperedens sp.]MCZ7370103.1 hypothetical protein [Candidatus Methanoperedens sp.]